MLSNSRRFTFLLILICVATGCRGVGSVIDDIPIPPVGSVLDDIPIPPVGSVLDDIPVPPVGFVMDDIALAAKANRVAEVVDGGIASAYQSPIDESGAVSSSRLRALILDFSCGATVDALQDGSVTWEDVRNEAALAFIGSFSDKFGVEAEADTIVLLWDTMDALENESDSNAYMVSQICSRLE